MRRSISIFAFIIICVTLVSCAKGHKGSKKELVLNSEQEYYAGRAVAAKILASKPLYHKEDPELAEYINDITNTLALYSDRAEIWSGYNVGVIKDDQVNAFSTSGGFIFITTGAIKAVQNEDHLAALLAHEVAHVNLRHPEAAALNAVAKSENAKDWMEAAEIGVEVLQFINPKLFKKLKMSPEEARKHLSGLLGQVVSEIGNCQSCGYEKRQELQADRYAVEFLYRAGYNPHAIVNVLNGFPKKMEGAEGWLTDKYPPMNERIKEAQESLREKGYGPKDENIQARLDRFKAKTAKLKG